MSTAREAVLKAALELDEDERLLLAAELMDSLADSLPGWTVDDPGFLEELDRRSRDGSANIPWEQVRKELQQDLGL